METAGAYLRHDEIHVGHLVKLLDALGTYAVCDWKVTHIEWPTGTSKETSNTATIRLVRVDDPAGGRR